MLEERCSDDSETKVFIADIWHSQILATAVSTVRTSSGHDGCWRREIPAKLIMKIVLDEVIKRSDIVGKRVPAGLPCMVQAGTNYAG